MLIAGCLGTFFSSTMLDWRLRCLRLGLFLPFMGVLASLLACRSAFSSALAWAAAASLACRASSGSRLTYHARAWSAASVAVSALAGPPCLECCPGAGR